MSEQMLEARHDHSGDADEMVPAVKDSLTADLQQPAAVVELTDDEIAIAMGWESFSHLDVFTYDNIEMAVLLKDIRSVIAAHIAKQSGERTC